jgi:hypothetical protein
MFYKIISDDKLINSKVGHLIYILKIENVSIKNIVKILLINLFGMFLVLNIFLFNRERKKLIKFKRNNIN